MRRHPILNAAVRPGRAGGHHPWNSSAPSSRPCPTRPLSGWPSGQDIKVIRAARCHASGSYDGGFQRGRCHDDATADGISGFRHGHRAGEEPDRRRNSWPLWRASKPVIAQRCMVGASGSDALCRRAMPARTPVDRDSVWPHVGSLFDRDIGCIGSALPRSRGTR